MISHLIIVVHYVLSYQQAASEILDPASHLRLGPSLPIPHQNDWHSCAYHNLSVHSK